MNNCILLLHVTHTINETLNPCDECPNVLSFFFKMEIEDTTAWYQSFIALDKLTSHLGNSIEYRTRLVDVAWDYQVFLLEVDKDGVGR